MLPFFEFLLTFAAGGMLTLVASYLTQKGKNIAALEDTRAITTQLEDVRRESAVAVERLRSDLQVLAHAQQTRFSRMHEKRAKAIDGLYRRCVRAQQAFLPLAGGFAPSADDTFDARLKDAGAAGQELLTYFAENRLYYDDGLVREYGRFNAALHTAWVTFTLDRRDYDVDVPQPERQRQVAAWQQARELVREQVPELLQSMEIRMRALLGGSEGAAVEVSAEPRILALPGTGTSA